MHLEIVSHCWRYSRLLNFQLSSLIDSPPVRTRVTMSVYFTGEDQLTWEVIEHFQRLAAGSNVAITPQELPRRKLMRREIGRNIAALNTQADWVWFTDCDYCFGDGALDSIEAEVKDLAAPLCFPRQILISETHQAGDALIDGIPTVPGRAILAKDTFAPRKIHYAFGGVQLVLGTVARDRGYLKDSKIQSWEADTWQRCIGDRWLRLGLGTRGIPIDVPNVYRIRHSRAGRFEDGLLL